MESVEDVRMLPEGLEVRVSEGSSAAPLVTLLVQAGAEIEEVRRDRPTLEEAFLELVTTDTDPSGDRQ
jgi:hypothetical protein